MKISITSISKRKIWIWIWISLLSDRIIKIVQKKKSVSIKFTKNSIQFQIGLQDYYPKTGNNPYYTARDNPSFQKPQNYNPANTKIKLTITQKRVCVFISKTHFVLILVTRPRNLNFKKCKKNGCCLLVELLAQEVGLFRTLQPSHHPSPEIYVFDTENCPTWTKSRNEILERRNVWCARNLQPTTHELSFIEK